MICIAVFLFLKNDNSIRYEIVLRRIFFLRPYSNVYSILSAQIPCSGLIDFQKTKKWLLR